MKQVKKEKDNYRKLTFLFPVVTSVVDAVIVLTALYISTLSSVSNVQMARLIMQIATILLAVSPTFLMINAFMSHRHMKKYQGGSSFYVKAPMIITLLVWCTQTLYMATLTGA